MRRLNTFLLAMLITGAIDSIRNLPATAMFGTTLVFFCIFAAIVFLIPTALVAAELSARLPKAGGVYHWARLAFGERTGFFVIWLQWINTMVWYPTILSFIAGTFAYLINPDLVHDRFYLIGVILVVFWGLTLLNFRGLQVSAKFAAVCTIIGMVLPMIFIIALGIIWLCIGKMPNIHMTFHNLFPHLTQGENWISLTAIMASFLGMELAAVHVQQVKRAQYTFPRALMISVTIILLTMILGSLAIAIVLPLHQISLVSGVVEAFQHFFAAYHLHWLLPVLVFMILIGSLGGMINWIISPAKGLLQAGQHGFLPAWLTKENKRGVAVRVLLVQAIFVTLICFVFLFMPSVNGSYWLLTDLSTELYLLMYVFMFLSGIRLHRKYRHLKTPFKIPGGEVGMWCICVLGIIGVSIAMIVGFIPPDMVNVGGAWHYELSFILGLLIMVAPVLVFYGYRWTKNIG